LDRKESFLQSVVAKDIAEARCDDRAHSPIPQSPHRMFAGRASAELWPRNENRRAGERWPVERKIRIVIAPGTKETVDEASLGNALQVDRRNDLVGIHIGATQGDGGTGVDGELLHRRVPLVPTQLMSAGAAKWPAIAVAAATGGETRC